MVYAVFMEVGRRPEGCKWRSKKDCIIAAIKYVCVGGGGRGGGGSVCMV